MSEQVGWRGFVRSLREETPNYATLLPQLPRLLHQRLNDPRLDQLEGLLHYHLRQTQQRNHWLQIIALILFAMLLWMMYATGK